MCPSSSPYSSPCFLIPKADPTALSHWVNDYRILNANTIPDVHPLPSIQEILSDCGRGKIWGKLDMTNSFFQTRVHPDDVLYTAVVTPFGLYKWTVMPQGCRNAPATHQCRMFTALRPYIGLICHVYLDDIIIWSNSLDEHHCNVKTILSVLCSHHLYFSRKKTDLFCLELCFLGHHISHAGVEADDSKVDKILSWPVPSSASDVRSFLGLIKYISNFLPALSQFTCILNTLTTKEAEHNFHWSSTHQDAFTAIKSLVVSRERLMVIDHQNMGDNKIFVCSDASDWCTGAIPSFGPTLESACPVAFDSMQLKGPELNYPVHEKELLTIVHALKKWHVNLIGVPFSVYTDHHTLKNFTFQKNLSWHQARWQEFLTQYNFNIVYLHSEDNTVADSHSRLPPPLAPLAPELTPIHPATIASLPLFWCAARGLSSIQVPPLIPPCDIFTHVATTHLCVATDPDWLTRIRTGYREDKWCSHLLRDLAHTVTKLLSEERADDFHLYLYRSYDNDITVPRLTM
ncbi:Transposon Tf2-12 polyprotein [Sparassis crispa]|uniref:Transposon Tf2-12 polyprotein n=1 Tax=Sparassis crispa TaxID=139825 RepID=A0A401GYT6_9APHY|nr:Transposon Tf2-12 polyprotein [Sparassis crispa]GBE87328.1 Transposon Tf2-12 polyprotein [Sparassis crispa]